MLYSDPTKSWKKQAMIDVTIAVIVVFLPLLSFLHLLIPQEGATIRLLGFDFAHGFADNQVFIWFVFMHISSFCFYTVDLPFFKRVLAISLVDSALPFYDLSLLGVL
jgi:hypothetical protein